MTCGQVWWPILGICALHLTHPSAPHTAVSSEQTNKHTHTHTHTPHTHTHTQHTNTNTTNTNTHTHTHTHTHTTHTHTHTHTHGAVGGHLCCGARGVVGGSVPCSRVLPQSWYWGWRERWTFTPPTYNPAGPETRTCNIWVTSPNPLGHDCPPPFF